MLDLVKTRPNSFAKFSPEAKLSQTAGKDTSSQPTCQPPSVMGSDEFSSLIESLAMQAGISVEDGLKQQGIETVDDVLPEMQSKVIDWFTARAEQAGA
jgi:hypothetical protein